MRKASVTKRRNTTPGFNTPDPIFLLSLLFMITVHLMNNSPMSLLHYLFLFFRLSVFNASLLMEVASLFICQMRFQGIEMCLLDKNYNILEVVLVFYFSMFFDNEIK